MSADPSARPPVFSPVRSRARFSRPTRRGPRLLEGARHLQEDAPRRDARHRAVEAAPSSSTRARRPPTACPTTATSSRASMKDLFPRYKTMRGYHVAAQGGLGHPRPPGRGRGRERAPHPRQGGDRDATASSPSSQRCIESVFRYTRRVGASSPSASASGSTCRDAYVTYHKSYVESVWWALSELFKKGLLYQGHKVCWWWPQGGTALSAGEVGSDYKTVDDPSVYVAFPLVERARHSLLVWTTTPWTLPSNGYAAVHPEFDYAVVDAGDAQARRRRGRCATSSPRSSSATSPVVGAQRVASSSASATGRRSTSSQASSATGARARPAARRRFLARPRRRLRHARRAAPGLSTSPRPSARTTSRPTAPSSPATATRASCR